MHENFSLKPYNTFGVDAEARYFTEANDVEQLKSAVNFAKSESLNLLFLGGGSNLLFTQHFDGLAVKINFKGISEEVLNENSVLVTAKAGENWHEFVMYCLEKNYGGLENLSLIPGNVGTSPMQNIGAYGTEIKDVFASCTVLNLETLEVETFNLEKCRFGYRDSIFKQEGKGKYVILEVKFKLTRKDHSIKTEYGAIQAELDKSGIQNPTIQDVSKAVINIRQSKLPDPKITGNAGSFFKNPTIPLAQFEDLKLKFENIQGYPNGNQVKVPAGWLIEQCGWKGKRIGNAASHQLQSLVIINATGKATGKEIFDFSAEIINSVKEKFGIELEREVNII
ncbi:UDP-N-acetylmuramate dehydrogenase [Chryseobacterium sp. H1D6B]|uniref:UDP-N-acetylmuramate dehydrogenase n=1 Tax=Chryseobacterium sp. H1D6B TaxID=2940588 RepID=UPI0015C99D2D|nr:UDP-N-acetylmuramate dehydrogenase [Chryseobacterium sp. H1D6B]MDH6250842.1 UDP-N-acetylmuramate dehydrogenase [Chryseobacterium sp. H1D6B]